MNDTEGSACALLAYRHTAFVEGVRDLLRTTFDTVFVVADDQSLREGAIRLHPTVIIVDLSFAAGDAGALLHQLGETSAKSKLIVLTTHDQAAAAQTTLRAGANAVVLKRRIAEDLLDAVDTVRLGKVFVSADIG